MTTAQVQIPVAATATPNEATPSGRDAQGRFTTANPGGPGNPFARRTAAMRRAFSEAISLDDLKTLAQHLMAEALKGDKAAAKLVLQYGLGKPAAQPDPDRLDIEEWRQYRQEATLVPELPKMVLQPNFDLPLEAVREARQCATERIGRQMGPALRDPDGFFAAQEKAREAEFRSREQADLRFAAKYEGFVPDETGLPPEIKPIQPKANGKNGGKHAERRDPPKANGQNGGSRRGRRQPAVPAVTPAEPGKTGGAGGPPSANRFIEGLPDWCPPIPVSDEPMADPGPPSPFGKNGK